MIGKYRIFIQCKVVFIFIIILLYNLILVKTSSEKSIINLEYRIFKKTNALPFFKKEVQKTNFGAKDGI